MSSIGLEALECESEEEARELANNGIKHGKWPCYFSRSDTTGEKSFEEFYMKDEELDETRFEKIGVILII